MKTSIMTKLMIAVLLVSMALGVMAISPVSAAWITTCDLYTTNVAWNSGATLNVAWNSGIASVSGCVSTNVAWNSGGY